VERVMGVSRRLPERLATEAEDAKKGD